MAWDRPHQGHSPQAVPGVPIYVEPSDGVQRQTGPPPDTLFADDFQAGLGRWTTSAFFSTTGGWEPLLGADDNIVAQTQGCPWTCSLTTAATLDLSAYASVSLSFDWWLDGAGITGLSVQVGDDGVYTTVQQYQTGGGTWQTATLTLTNLSDAFTLRFTGSGEGIVLDNVVLRAGPASAEPETPDSVAGVMGGDGMAAKVFHRSLLKYGGYGDRYGTLTLGGLETTDGTKGFVASGHAVAEVLAPLQLPESGYVLEDDGDYYDGGDDDTLLGKIFRMPRIYTEGTKEIAGVDAGFVMYPRASTLGCSVIYQHDGKTFCFDAGQGTYTETVQPLVVRGRNDTVHRVIGSRQPTEGLAVRISGSRSGVIDDLRVSETMILSKAVDTIGTDRPLYVFYNYARKPGQYTGVGAGMGGDSGGPVYTVPNKNGDVRMVGVHVGGFISVAGYGTFFSSWDDVTDALDLKPIVP